VEALEQVFHTYRTALEAVNETLRCPGVSLADGTVAVAIPPPPPTNQQKTAQRRAYRVACPQQVWALRAQGWPGHAIAAHLGIGKSTVFCYLRTPTLPERKRRSDRDRSVLNPYKPYVLERWNAGCRNALRLFRELQQHGYPGSYTPVVRYAQRLRQAQSQGWQRQAPQPALSVVAKLPHRLLTARQAAWLVLRREDTRPEEETHVLAQLRAQHPDVAEAITLTQDFARLLRQRQGEHLDAWLARVAQSAIVALQRFAKGLADDYEAVKAGLTLPWSMGPVEGHLTRLKLLKRQMFGRASLALLQQRFVLAPRQGPGRVQRPQARAEAQAQPAAA
jgi:transposase